MVCNEMQVVLIVAPLVLLTMRLMVFLWDKMHMKMVMLLPRCVHPMCYVLLNLFWECSILVH